MRIRSKLAGAIIIAAAALTVPGVANGALSACPSGHICLWGNNDFQWKIADRTAGDATITNLRGDANNQMDSWANRSANHTGCGFGAANATGDRQTFGKNKSDDNVAPWNSDEVSSWRTRYGC